MRAGSRQSESRRIASFRCSAGSYRIPCSERPGAVSVYRRLVCNAPEPDVVHTRIDHLRLPRRWTIAQAVVRRAQVRAAFDHLARNLELCLRGIVALVGRNDTRIDCWAAAGLDHFVGVM